MTGLTESFAGLARIYERHYRTPNAAEPVPKLYVMRLATGSILAEIAPYATMLGTIISTMDGGMVISDFTRRLYAGLKAFSDPSPSSHPDPARTREDAADLQAFVRPLAGKRGAHLNLRHARYERSDQSGRTVVEYDFDETEINRATVNIDSALTTLAGAQSLLEMDGDVGLLSEGSILTEVMLFFEQASRRPGKEKGRTGDRGIVPDVTSKPLPVYFRRSIQDLKDLMIRGEINPLSPCSARRWETEGIHCH